MSNEQRRLARTGRTCILHLGMHKTGSSSIQHTLFHAPPSPDWSLVRAKTGNAGFALHAVFGSPDNGQATLQRIGMNAERLANFSKNSRRRLKQSIAGNSPLCVLSAEALTRLDADELTRLKTWLLQWVEHIRVVGYVRAPHEFMESSLQERIKSGHLKQPTLAKAYPGYRQRLEKFDQVFGRDRVELRPFDPASFPQGDVVQDFARWVGIPLPNGPTTRTNEGLSGHALRLLHASNRVKTPTLSVAQRHKAQRRLAISLQSLRGPKLRLAPSVIAPLLAAEQADLDWIAQRLGTPLRLLREPRPDTDMTDLADLDQIGAEALTWLRQALAEAGLGEWDAHADQANVAAAMARLLIHHAHRPDLGSDADPDTEDDELSD